MNINEQMFKWMKEIFHLPRSLTGDGNKKTINYLKKINPEWKIIKFKTGKKVFDWIIPKVWNVKDAYIEHSSGKKYAEFSKNNLHLVNYSIPVKKKNLSLDHIKKKIYSLPKQPKLIPYVTSYYHKDWGFCMSENEIKKMPKNGKYSIEINTSLTNGNLEVAEIFIKGKSNKEIFFSTYLCHPSLANDNLSGVVLINGIILFLKDNYRKPFYSYRFVMVPETIGSIAYLSKKYKLLQKNVISGFNLSCVGDNRIFSMVESRTGKSLADQSLKYFISHKRKNKIYKLSERGSDERQYCSPRINLPLVTFCRSKFHTFPEYHTSADNLDLISEQSLGDSLEIFMNIIKTYELGIYPKSLSFGEPFLKKYNLHKKKSIKNDRTRVHKIRSDLVNYADGKTNIFQIFSYIGGNFENLYDQYTLLKEKKLLR
tara:strand:- start:6073 stop:7353 length:1281 start_codon:yes stop_codon:yes gene_type:complete